MTWIEGRMDELHNFGLFCSGGVFFTLLYHLVFWFTEKFPNLSIADKCVISLRVVSAIQALMACWVGITIINTVENIMKDRHWLTNAYACFGASYFYYDTWAMYQEFWHTTDDLHKAPMLKRLCALVERNRLMMCHHLLLPIIYLPIIVYWRNGAGDFFVGCFFLFELAIPFISLRSILIQLHLRDSLLYTVNGLVLIAMFALCRVLIFPYLYWAYSQHIHTNSVLLVPKLIPIKCNVGCLALMTVQIFWLYKMVLVAVKTVQRRIGYVEAIGCHQEGYFDLPSVKKA